MNTTSIIFFLVFFISSCGLKKQAEGEASQDAEARRGGMTSGGGFVKNPIGAEKAQKLIIDTPRYLHLIFNGLTVSSAPEFADLKKTFFSKGHDGFELLQTIHFQDSKEKPCHHDGEPHDGSYQDGVVCLSSGRLGQNLEANDAAREIVALAIHELAHAMGKNEKDAIALQQDVLQALAFGDDISFERLIEERQDFIQHLETYSQALISQNLSKTYAQQREFDPYDFANQNKLKSFLNFELSLFFGIRESLPEIPHEFTKRVQEIAPTTGSLDPFDTGSDDFEDKDTRSNDTDVINPNTDAINPDDEASSLPVDIELTPSSSFRLIEDTLMHSISQDEKTLYLQIWVQDLWLSGKFKLKTFPDIIDPGPKLETIALQMKVWVENHLFTSKNSISCEDVLKNASYLIQDDVPTAESCTLPRMLDKDGKERTTAIQSLEKQQEDSLKKLLKMMSE